MGLYRKICAALTIFLISISSGRVATAADAWTCFKMVSGKAHPVRYVINGQIMLHGDGSSHSKILVNDDKLVISFATFMTPSTRYPKNSKPVEIDEPVTIYFIMDRSRNRLFTLSNMLTAVVTDNLGKMIDPDLDTMDCTKD
jgi:hypothetical protein